MIRHHPDSHLLLEHVAGSLSWNLSLAVSAHLQMCMACRQALYHLNQVGGTLLESATPVAPASDSFVRLSARLDQSEASAHQARSSGSAVPLHTSAAASLDSSDGIPLTLPPVLHKLIANQEALSWQPSGPALSTANLTGGPAGGLSHRRAALCRLAPGGSAPEHSHVASEATLILSGSFSDNSGLYLPGDFLLKDTGDARRPTATQDKPCVYLAVSDAPVVPTGLWRRLARPLSGLRSR